MIDARALVSPQAELAADVTVGPYAVIGPNVRIGARTRVAAHAVINGPTTIGTDNVIFQFASIGDAPQDLKYKGEPTRLEIGDRNVFRECCTVNRGTADGEAVTRVGNDNLLMAYTHIAHDCHIGSRIVMANYSALSGHVELGDWVIMAGYSGVHQFCKVGAHAFIANNTAVTNLPKSRNGRKPWLPTMLATLPSTASGTSAITHDRISRMALNPSETSSPASFC